MRISIGSQVARFLISTKISPSTSIRVSTRAFTCLLSSACPKSQSQNSQSKSYLQSFVSQNWSIHQQLRNKMSLVRQNFAEECEAGINRQINFELYASYVYQSMAFHFDRSELSLPGFHKFFKKQSDDEREHAEKLMKYQNMRGGRILLQDVKKPEGDEWGNGLEAMTSALKLEKSVNQALIDLHKIAENNGDAQFCDFLEGEFLKEQVESIKEISDFVSQLTRVGPGLGEYMFDKETLQEKFE